MGGGSQFCINPSWYMIFQRIKLEKSVMPSAGVGFTGESFAGNIMMI